MHHNHYGQIAFAKIQIILEVTNDSRDFINLFRQEINSLLKGVQLSTFSGKVSTKPVWNCQPFKYIMMSNDCAIVIVKR